VKRGLRRKGLKACSGRNIDSLINCSSRDLCCLVLLFQGIRTYPEVSLHMLSDAVALGVPCSYAMVKVKNLKVIDGCACSFVEAYIN
jgi:hypothetical protein